ncbi:PREDICTED: filamin-interacting protein FAM101B [Corvus brachyrhynchos]|uniref:filamin-interacting protein FAM101B n=1 Tax=Corvus brachyrhynchos TaxID=85066 RepID=UPI00081658F6|nr:PREDICTED: filamin-interacting protein FAM101B [Corvus brachyrhynchos]
MGSPGGQGHRGDGENRDDKECPEDRDSSGTGTPEGYRDTGIFLQSSVFSPSPVLSSCPPRLCPLSFGEGVEFDPLPPKEIRYTSSVRYDSEKHFIDDVYLPVGLSVASCSQTIVCVPNCSWRSYKAEVRFEPRHRPRRFTSTTIIYPKHAKTVYTTTLDYNCRKATRRFLSSVELETSEYLGTDCGLDGC